MTSERVSQQEEWLVRRDAVDYGPYVTGEVLSAIAGKQIDLGTLIADLNEVEFEPLGTWALFRDHYAECHARWEQEVAEEEARRAERRLRAARVARMTTFVIVLVIALGSAGFGGWIAWRIMKARPTGVDGAVAMAAVPRLPELAPKPSVVQGEAPKITTKQVARLHEPTFFDTRGVGVEGEEASSRPVLNFNAAARDQLAEAKVSAIVSKARKGLVACARAAAQASPDFTGTRVRFLIRSGGIGAVTVGKEVASNGAFRQCAKRALAGIAVPAFRGDERSVSIPLKVNR
jgi:pimeloyl-ACP methyl ester carboxylesterase